MSWLLATIRDVMPAAVSDFSFAAVSIYGEGSELILFRPRNNKPRSRYCVSLVKPFFNNNINLP